MSKCASSIRVQNPLAQPRTSERASGDVVVERAWNTLPLKGFNFGSIATLLQTSDSRVPTMSLTSLWRMVGKPPKGTDHCMIRRKVLATHTCQGRVLQLPAIPYIATASRKSCFLTQNPCSFSGNAVSHEDDPFSDKCSICDGWAGHVRIRFLQRTASALRRWFFIRLLIWLELLARWSGSNCSLADLARTARSLIWQETTSTSSPSVENQTETVMHMAPVAIQTEF